MTPAAGDRTTALKQKATLSAYLYQRKETKG